MTFPVEWTDPWCRHCGTMHHGEDDCPGDLLATGTESHGWRVLVDTPRGPEVYGALIAPTGDRWRARILTYPNILWVVPRGHSMKFLGATPGEAERAAIRYIREHCRVRCYAVRTEVPAVNSRPVDAERNEGLARTAAERSSDRPLCAAIVRYGSGRATRRGETDNLSEGGLFIRTDEPFPVGTRLRLQVDTGDGVAIPLRGVVRWTRDGVQEGRPCGMGIELIDPHPRYVEFARRQTEPPDERDEAPTYEVEEWHPAPLPAVVPEQQRPDR